jgi:hypothetical protein
MFDMPEDLTSDDAYFEAIQANHAAEEARDRAYRLRAAAGNPLSRFISNAVAKYRDIQYFDSEEHVGLIEELRQLDAAKGQLDATPAAPAAELPPELYDF